MKAMDWQRRVEQVQDHIRRHLDAELGLEALAAVAGASRFHFARRFRAETGETLNHFVQRARLERAANLMKARPERRLIDVALEAGFGSDSDFSRVFRQHYGVAPSAWDRKQSLQASLPNYEDHLAAARATCPPLSVEVRAHEELRLAYVRVATPFADTNLLEAGFRELTGWFEAAGVDWRKRPFLAMSWDQPETTPLDQVKCDLCIPLPAGLPASGAVSERRIPAHRAAHVHVDGELPHTAVAWEYLYDTWLPRTGEEPADLPAMKRFHRRPDELGWFRLDVDCCLPLSG